VLLSKILMLAGEDGEPFSVIRQRVGKKYEKEDVQKAVDLLVSQDKLKKVEKGGRGRPSVRYAQSN
jgi:outer membrane protein assembly factor BamA